MLSLLIEDEIVSLAVCLADIFGFSPVGSKWMPNPAEIAREGIPLDQVGWWVMVGLVPFTELESLAFADALERAIAWLKSSPDGFPDKPARDERFWNWDGLWELCKWEGSMPELQKIHHFLLGGAFHIEAPNGSANNMRLLVHDPV